MMDDHGTQYRHRGWWSMAMEEEHMDDMGFPFMVPVWDCGGEG